jgi:hypothetical protein
MKDAGIGRVLVASLHQGIADLLPSRLEFYENWFNPAGLRDGTIGLAPLTAVLSFLRREGAVYALVTDRAGLYAAEWTVEGLPAFERALIHRMPEPLRLRLALRVARALVKSSNAGSRAIVRVRRGTATVDVRSSIFCAVREPAPAPLCGFYAAATRRVLELLRVTAAVDVGQCRGTGQPGCVLLVRAHGVPAATAPLTSDRT